jgi:type IV fimbrial biogenesis protein FimT
MSPTTHFPHRFEPPRRTRAEAGFTLIELMVTLTVTAIVLAMAAPSFGSLLASNRMSTQTSEFIGALNLARSEAVRRAQPVALRANDQDNYAKGWKVFSDSDADGAIPGTVTADNGTVIREASAFTGSPTVKRQTCSGTPCTTYANSTAADRIYLVFNARGGIESSADVFFKVCDPSNTSVKGRRVKVNAVGKVSLLSTNETCP